MGPETTANPQPTPQTQNNLELSTRPPGTVPTFDPIRLFAPVQEFFIPIGKDETNTMLGLWFDAIGLLHVYVQQAIVPDNVFTQVKIITLRLPIPFGFMLANMIQATFYARAAVLAVRAATAQTTIQVQGIFDRILERIRTKALRGE